LQSAALTGVVLLIGAIAVFGLILSSEQAARWVGNQLCAVASRVARLVGRSPYEGWGEGLVRFRAQSIELLQRRWHVITVATVVSHLSLFALLLMALRHMGVPAADVSGPEALATFTLVRLVTAIPMTPGNIGIVEVGLAAGLALSGGDEPLVVAAVLIYRALSYLLQVPLGLVAYIIWRSKKSWRVPSPGQSD
jgi:uncharacterized protein (TIRG00374 family)